MCRCRQNGSISDRPICTLLPGDIRENTVQALTYPNHNRYNFYYPDSLTAKIPIFHKHLRQIVSIRKMGAGQKSQWPTGLIDI